MMMSRFCQKSLLSLPFSRFFFFFFFFGGGGVATHKIGQSYQESAMDGRGLQT